MKILIGVDDSPCSAAAVEFVKRMTWPAGTEVELLCALQPISAPALAGGAPYTDYVAEAWEEQCRMQQELVARLERDLKQRGFRTHAATEVGDPRVVLVEAARAHGIDLLVVGSHGRSGLSKLVLGSVASHIVVHAPCDVVVVKRPAKS